MGWDRWVVLRGRRQEDIGGVRKVADIGVDKCLLFSHSTRRWKVKSYCDTCLLNSHYHTDDWAALYRTPTEYRDYSDHLYTYLGEGPVPVPAVEGHAVEGPPVEGPAFVPWNTGNVAHRGKETARISTDGIRAAPRGLKRDRDDDEIIIISSDDESYVIVGVTEKMK
ncbi:hypothetical protein M422DRAFT_63249 [Sphaerobolus stellatus SS14]|nr:hypothetical protein M422DRAFT_63249 [Sphaerobolus stellatus SS14]